MMDAEDFNGIMAGIADATAYMRGDATRGRMVAGPDVRAIRGRTKLTQEAFARTFHFKAATVRDWEQGRRVPDTGSVTLLKMIEADPEGVQRIIEKADV
jgi:putative transcriptional regulator